MDTQVLIMLVILVATIVMLIFEVVRVDVVAIICMLVLGWTQILQPDEMLSGFSSNAVIATMAVMILGRGIARTGLMDRFSRVVVKRTPHNRRRITTTISLAVGLVSGFIQNIGAAVLFLPSTLNIARKTNIPASALVMPMGFAVILGGTLTMVGSGHLILVNDLLQNAGLEPYGLLSVTPIGLLLLGAGIAFFFFFGKYVLPRSKPSDQVTSAQEKLIEALRLPSNIWHFAISSDSPLIGQTTEGSGIWRRFNVNIIGISDVKDVIYAPWRETKFRAGQELALLGAEENIKKMAEAFRLIPEALPLRFQRLHDPEEAGFAEVIIRPRSEAVGQTFRDYAMRRRFAVEPLRLFSKGDEMRGDFSDHKITPGDTVIVYGLWEKIQELKDTVDFVVTTPFRTDQKDYTKTGAALLSFVLAIGLTLAGFPISMAFFTGAMVMVLTRVLSIQQAYQAIDWKVVFLLAGLIPLGIAMRKTGTATFLATEIMQLAAGGHIFFIILIVGAISTIFSLLISNIGAIVVLAPMVAGIAEISGIDPRPLVLMSAICVSNAFILPTQQVNALLMTAGGYRSSDFLKAGSGLTVLFLIITTTFFYVFYF